MLITKSVRGAVLCLVGVVAFSVTEAAYGYESFAFQSLSAANRPAADSYAGLPANLTPMTWDPATGLAYYSGLAAGKNENADETSIAGSLAACKLIGSRFDGKSLVGSSDLAAATHLNPFVIHGRSQSPMNLAPAALPAHISKPQLISVPSARNVDFWGNPIPSIDYSSPDYIDYESKKITFIGKWKRHADGTYTYEMPVIRPGYYHSNYTPQTFSYSLNSPTPEPSTWVLLAAGVLGFGVARIRKSIHRRSR
jgi:hypothetical protein